MMDRRTIILSSVFGVLIVYGIFTKVVYPNWIHPLITIDDGIAEAQDELDKLTAQLDAVQRVRYEYREWAGRTGSFDITEAITEIRERLNKLLERHALADVKIMPTRPSEDRKTGLWTASVSVSGSGALDSMVRFLRDLSELPHLCRTGNASISPASSRGRTTINRYNLRVPIEVWAVPQHRMVGRLSADDLVHPDLFVRHQGQEYDTIWKGDPFNEYVPMRVATRPTLTVVKGKRAALDVTVEGGIGPYTYEWSPAAGLSSAKIKSPQVDASEEGRQTYTVRVADARGHTGSSTISVTIAEPKPPVPIRPTADPTPAPVARGPRRSKDGQLQRLVMVMTRRSDGERRDEIMVTHARTKQTSYYAVGDEFEGGKLIFVYPTGGLVNWEDEYYVYPLGESLDRFVAAEKAFDYPVLQRAAGKHLELTRQLAAAQNSRQQEPVPSNRGKSPDGPAATPATAGGRPPDAGPKGSDPPTGRRPANRGAVKSVPAGSKESADDKKKRVPATPPKRVRVGKPK